MHIALVNAKSDAATDIPQLESILNDNRCLSSFDALVKMRDEKTQLVSDCLLKQWTGGSVLSKSGTKSKKCGSKFRGVFEQVTVGCLLPSCQAVSFL